MNKDRRIKKHVNIHLITLIVTIFTFALMDLLKVYSLSAEVMIVFLVGYSLYIIISTVYLLVKYDSIDEGNERKKSIDKTKKN